MKEELPFPPRMFRLTSEREIVLALQAVSAQVVSPMLTGTNVNGRYWNTLSVESKATFIIGVGEGMAEVVWFAP
jgi:hypothetical protein